ncbi:MAG: hypothetical protein QOJ72_899 [Nocardioidaceae bacterium]|nr:hypothetical protein [Nocardioidaceae bacterium]
MPEPSGSTFLRPAFLTAALATVASGAVAAVIVVAGHGSAKLSFAGLVRSSARAWLVSVGSGLDAGQISLELVPLGATLLCIALVAVTAAWVASEPVEELGAFSATTAGALGVIAGIASSATNSGDIHTSVVRAAFGAFAVGGLGAALGAGVRHRSADRLWFTANRDVRAVVRAAVPGVLAVLGSSAAIVLVLLILHLPRASDLWAALEPGLGGGFALAVICILAVPTLVLWTAAALIGPGFQLGTHTSVDLTGAQLGAVPGLPILAALPSPGAFPGWVIVLNVIPLAAGMLAGWKVDAGEREDILSRVGLGAAAGAVAGFLLGVLVAISGGAIGPGRMADAGPPTLTPLLVAVPVMALGGALGAALAHYRGTRAKRPSDTSSTGRPRLWKRHQSPGADRRHGES